MNYVRKQSKRGSTLIEVILATTVVVMTLTALAVSITMVNRNQRISASHEAANKYAQEGVEWLRSVRDAEGWDAFYTAVSAGTAKCMQTVPSTATVTAYSALTSGACGGAQSVTSTPVPLFREFTMTVIGPSEIRVNMTVRWTDGSRNLSSDLTVTLREWQ